MPANARDQVHGGSIHRASQGASHGTSHGNTKGHELLPLAECACASATAGRKAAGVDPELKDANRKRLRRIEGQVRGLQKMVEEDRYCPDIIVQVASVQEALRGVARNLMKNHLHHCAAKALKSGKKEEAQALYDELLELIYTHLR